jgi:hypothetical protein
VPFFIEAISSIESKKHFGSIIENEDCTIFVLEGEKFNKTCALLRGLGMQIFILNRFKSSNRFIAVFRPRPSSKLDKVLRGSENPEHDKWQGDRFESDPTYAKKIIKKTEGWIRSVIKELSPVNNTESSDLFGMSTFFPDITSKIDDSKTNSSLNEGDNTSLQIRNSIGNYVTLGIPSKPQAKKRDTTSLPGKNKNTGKSEGEKKSPQMPGDNYSKNNKNSKRRISLL